MNEDIIERMIRLIPECWSKECMGCEWDELRNHLEKVKKKYE